MSSVTPPANPASVPANVPPVFRFRFVGRFVFAQPLDQQRMPKPGIQVLAINMQFNPIVNAVAHRFVMMVRRDLVDASSTKLPDEVVMAAVRTPEEAEQSLWILDGYDLSLAVQGGADAFTWPPPQPTAAEPIPARIADLDDLLVAMGSNARFDRNLVTSPTPDGLIQGRLPMTVGTASVRRIAAGRDDFVPLGKPKTHKPPRPDVRLADFVEIVATPTPPPNPPTPGQQNEQPFLYLTLTPRADGPRAEEPTHLLAIALDGEDTIVTFSNLCTQPTRAFDDEFAGFYEVVAPPPPLFDRLVPRAITTLGGTEDCYPPTHITFDDVG